MLAPLLAWSPLLVLAQGEDAEAATGGGFSILFLIAMFAVFYLLLVRPQQKRAKKQREIVSSVEVNDRIVTLGGIHGTVRYSDDQVIHLEVAPGTTVTFSKGAVAKKLIEDDIADDEPETELG
jgi:preprotein translocase subunit YajC